MLKRLRGSTSTGLFEDQGVGLVASGVPISVRQAYDSHVGHQALLEKLTSCQQQLQKSFTTALTGLAETIHVERDGLAEALANRIRQKFSIKGAAALTPPDVRGILDEELAPLHAKVQQLHQLVAGLPPPPAPQPQAETQQVESPAQDGLETSFWWKEWHHSGHLSLSIPPGYKVSIQGLTTHKAFNLYHFGDRHRGVRPWKLFQSRDLINPSSPRTPHNEYAKLHNVIKRFFDPNPTPKSESAMAAVPTEEVGKKFQVEYDALLTSLYTHLPKDPNAVSIGTIYNRLSKTKQLGVSDFGGPPRVKRKRCQAPTPSTEGRSGWELP